MIINVLDGEITMDNCDNMLYALEVLNKELLCVLSSDEYLHGKKIFRWREIIKNHKIISCLPDFFKHRKIKESYINDSQENFSYNEWKSFLHYGNPEYKIALFTCITGEYDQLKEPLLKLKNVDYYLFSDSKEIIKEVNSQWVYREIPVSLSGLSNTVKNRYIKMHPFELFGDKYDFSIYIDGNVQIISDISVFAEMIDPVIGIAAHTHRFRDCIYLEEKICELKGKGNIKMMRNQIEKYKKDSFPEHFGLIECTVLVTQLTNMFAKSIYEQWWNEFLTHGSMRDQLSLPYVLWKNGINVSDIGKLGKNLYRNTKIKVSGH